MRKIALFAILLLLVITAQAQRVSTKIGDTSISISTKDIVKVFNLDVKVPKTKEQQIGKAEVTQSTAIYKGIEYPVYITAKGKLFIVYPNKENTGFNKKYIKDDTFTEG